MVATSEARPTSRLFWKKTANPIPFQTVSKCSNVIGHGRIDVDPLGRNAKTSIQ